MDEAEPSPDRSTSPSIPLQPDTKEDVVEQGKNEPVDTTRAISPSDVGWDRAPTVLSRAASPPSDVPARSLRERLTGTELGDYFLEAYVGGGGMGAVFRARDLRLQRTVAVKVLAGGLQSATELRRRFEQEARSAARLSHENIATVFDVGEANGWSFIVFEFLDGINLRDFVARDGPLSIADALNITRQIAAALSHAATRDVVHRDIKPSNILVGDDGRAKLVDMGLARAHAIRADDADLTESGVTLGTFDYISPEQARDPRSADLRSDIYSLGCTLYFMLTGRPPFPEGTVLQKLLSHNSEEPTDPAAFRADIPDGLLHVLRRMTAKSPDDRYQHPDALRDDLSALEVGSTARFAWAGSESPDNTRRRLRYHLPWMVTCLLLPLVVWGAESLLPSPDLVTTLPTFPLPLETPHQADRPEATSRSEETDDIPGEEAVERPRRVEAATSDSTTNQVTDSVAPADRAPVGYVVVSVADHRYDGDAVVVSTLQDAIDYCEAHPRIERIEIDQPQLIIPSPLEIQPWMTVSIVGRDPAPTVQFESIAGADPP